jgi:hypothetical protein
LDLSVAVLWHVGEKGEYIVHCQTEICWKFVPKSNQIPNPELAK